MTQEQRNISELERNAEYHARMAESCRHYRKDGTHPHRTNELKAHQEQCAYYAAQIPT